jgi:glycyl-tRNA synthetase
MNLLEKISSLAKRRGFIYPGSEIYGGLAGFYDWGHLGNELKFNIKQTWWRDTVQLRDDVVGLSAAIVMNPKAWEASGHLTGFSDVLVECPKCHKRFKADELGKKNESLVCVECSEIFKGKARQFNLMFKTFVGAAEEAAAVAYLRPETAGGIFVNFKNVLQTNRLKIPFGIAQIGKAFRNEINPRDFVFRIREFEQMELEYFIHPVRNNPVKQDVAVPPQAAGRISNGVKPQTPTEWLSYWVGRRLKWYESIGLKNIRLREQSQEERAHYSRATVDIEYKFPFGWQEIEGVANRGDFDLTAQMKVSGKDLNYFDEETKEQYTPYVIEPSAGVERIALAVLCEAYLEEKERIVLKLNSKLAPYKAAVFPLLANKEKLVELARSIYDDLKTEFMTAWDDRGNIGKRYYSQDEIGTPFCITVDFESLEKNDVTVRGRDTMKQVRVGIRELKEYLKKKLVK